MDSGQVRGTPRPILADANALHYAVSPNGTAVYVHFPAGSGSQVVRVDRSGRPEPLLDRREVLFRWPRLSPDGERLAVGIANVGGDGIRLGASRGMWVYDLESQRRNRLQDAGAFNSEPVWSPDGDRVVYSSAGSSVSHLYWQPSDGGGTSEPLSEEPLNQWPTSFSSDGSLLAFYVDLLDTNGDLYILSVKDGASEAVLEETRLQRGARFSPNDNWLAYSSNHTGQTEVYIRPYPDMDREIPVSTDGGFEPAWSVDGTELFYRNANQMIAVEITGDQDSPIGPATVLFEETYAFDRAGDQSYDVFPDGQHFVMVQPNPDIPPRLRVVTGFLGELSELAPVE